MRAVFGWKIELMLKLICEGDWNGKKKLEIV
jgi:hypothetical protein